MEHMKPLGSPPCWSKKYQDGEEECTQCRFQDSCKQEMLYQITRPGPSVVRNYPPPPRLNPSPTTSTMIPLPPKPYFAPPVSSIPVPIRTLPPVTAPPIQQPTQTSYYQQTTGFSLPSIAAQNPLASWHRPGAPSPPYYFTQYPGENTGLRLLKNIILRALEAICAELMQYFRHWTWPANPKSITK